MMNAITSNFGYIVVSLDMWHGILDHVNIALIRRLKEFRLINASETNEISKCHVCVETKFIKKPFKSVMSINTEFLELIRYDLADFKTITSRVEKIIIYLLSVIFLDSLRFIS